MLHAHAHVSLLEQEQLGSSQLWQEQMLHKLLQIEPDTVGEVWIPRPAHAACPCSHQHLADPSHELRPEQLRSSNGAAGADAAIPGDTALVA